MRYSTNLGSLLLVALGCIGSQQTSAEEISIALFKAIDQGDVTVKFIALNAKQANVLITNESDKPLQLKLPKVIAAVPALGQFGQNPNQNQNQNGNPVGGGTNQGVGGGFNIGNGQGLGNGQGFGDQNGFGMGIMRIAAGKVHQLKANTVCLEHGKPDPKPQIPYQMIPLETFTTDPVVSLVCTQLGTGQIRQNVAQAIVWHHSNGLSWKQLAELDRVQSLYRGNIKFFSPEDLDTAKFYYASSSESNSPVYQSSSPTRSDPASASGLALSDSDIHHSTYSDARSGYYSTCQ